MSAPHVTRLSALGIGFLIAWEGGLRTEAYLCPAGVATISAGCTRYEDGSRVSLGDKISTERALLLFRAEARKCEAAVDALTHDLLTREQFDALVSFVWNEGERSYETSTLLALVNRLYPPKAIREQLLRWRFADTDPKHPGLEEVHGLRLRRAAEADVYERALYVGPSGEAIA